MNNKKLKVYLDTSVISHLKQDDAIDKTKITNDLWKRFKTNIFDVCLSDLTLLEVGRCDEPKASYLRDRLKEILYEDLKLMTILLVLLKK